VRKLVRERDISLAECVELRGEVGDRVWERRPGREHARERALAHDADLDRVAGVVGIRLDAALLRA
jgi:hypothetical protein